MVRRPVHLAAAVPTPRRRGRPSSPLSCHLRPARPRALGRASAQGGKYTRGRPRRARARPDRRSNEEARARRVRARAAGGGASQFAVDAGATREAVVHVSLVCDCGEARRTVRGGRRLRARRRHPGRNRASLTQRAAAPVRARDAIHARRGRTRPARRAAPRARSLVPRKARRIFAARGRPSARARTSSSPTSLLRAASGDRGGRPYSGVFWESPDVFVAPDQAADTAPADAGGRGRRRSREGARTRYTPTSGTSGKSPAYRRPRRVLLVQPEPRLLAVGGEPRRRGATSTSATASRTSTAGQRSMSRTARWLSRGCHAIVRCPTTGCRLT